MIEQYDPATRAPTSGGESRQIRAGYGEREIYTRWVRRRSTLAGSRSRMGQEALFRTGQLSLAREWTKELTDTRKVFDKLREVRSRAHDDLPRAIADDHERRGGGDVHAQTGVLKAREGCVAVAQAFEKKGGRF